MKPAAQPRVPTASVYLPTYNSGAYLKATVESILNQTHDDFEFVIVDDGSTDGTREALAAYARQDTRIRLFLNKHLGIAGAMNFALRQATGEIAFCMNHDDVARPERIERQLAFLVEHPEIAAVGASMQAMHENGHYFSLMQYPQSSDEIEECMRAGSSPIGHPTLAVRRDIVLALGGYRPQFPYAEDFDLFLRLSDNHRLANMPDVLMDYRAHVNNSTSLHRGEQSLSARVAWLASQARRRGLPDPTEHLTKLTVDDLYRFEIPTGQRHEILIGLAQDSVSAYRASGDVRRLMEADRYLHAEHIPPSALLYATSGDLARCWRERPTLDGVSALRDRFARYTQPYRSGPARGRRRVEGASIRLAQQWLAPCADPGRRLDFPAQRLAPEAAAELVEQATAHNVLPAILRNFPPFAENDPDYSMQKRVAQDRNRIALARTVMLMQTAVDLSETLSGLPAGIVRGPVFARTIYDAPGARTFADLNLLVAPEALQDTAARLQAADFERLSADYPDDVWRHRNNQALQIQVQTDLAAPGKLRGDVSLVHEDVAGHEDSSAVQLVLALIAACYDKNFSQLRALVDICQAARALKAEDESAFVRLVETTGARLAAVAGLDLAARLFDEPRCRELAQAIGPTRRARLARWLLVPETILSVATPARDHWEWRRRALGRLVGTTRAGRIEFPFSSQPPSL